MAASKSTAKAARRKPTKPRPDFPLFAHAVGQWAKKVRGRMHYFGRWDDPQAALNRWLEQKDDLLAGRAPKPARPEGVTIRDLANQFLTSKKDLLGAGEICERTFQEYFATCARLVKVFRANRLVDDLTADDFRQLRAQVAKKWGPIRLSNEIQRVRSIFKFGYDSGTLDKPVRFGPGFKKPSAKVLRQNRAKRGSCMFEPHELRAALDVAGDNMRAMMLLGINCGLGNNDVALLRPAHLDLDRGWLNYPRPKTGIDRRCPLWPETIAAIQVVLGKRPNKPRPDNDHALLFIGRRGKPYTGSGNGYRVAQELERVLTCGKLARPGLSFYGLRHTFQTVGEGARDFIAVRAIMGHSPPAGDMSQYYRERVDDARLQAVVDHVRGWLFADAAGDEAPAVLPMNKIG
jgi:integrase